MSNPCHSSAKFISVLDGFLILMLILMAAVGNIFIIIVIYKLQEFRIPSNIFVACLSVADLFIAFVPLPLSFAIYVTCWDTSEKQFDTYVTLDILSSTISIVSLMAIALDRYFVIVHPYKYERHISELYAVTVCCLVWVCGLFAVLLYLVVPEPVNMLCIIIATYVLPTSVMLTCYVRIAVVAKRHAKNIFNLERQTLRKRKSYIRRASKQRSVGSNPSVESVAAIDLTTTRGMTKFLTRLNREQVFHAVADENSTLEPSTSMSPGEGEYREMSPFTIIREETHSEHIMVVEKNNVTTDGDEIKLREPAGSGFMREDLEISPRLSFSRPSMDVSGESTLHNSLAAHLFKRSVVRNVKARRNTNFLRRETLKIVNHLRRLKRELKASAILAVVMGTFLCLWTPFFAVNIKFTLSEFDPLNSGDVFLLKYFKLLHYANSAVNPACYIILNSRWKKMFKKFSKKCWNKLGSRNKNRIHPV